MGNGVTDDSDAIQAVITANVNSKVVYFPAGTLLRSFGHLDVFLV